MTILYAFLLVALYGFFKSITDIVRDQNRTNWLYHHLPEWFYSGKGQSQRFPWDQDLWHLADDCKLVLLIAAFLLGGVEGWYWYPLPMFFVAGRTFALFYHVLWPDVPSESFWRWLANCVLFWRAENR